MKNYDNRGKDAPNRDATDGTDPTGSSGGNDHTDPDTGDSALLNRRRYLQLGAAAAAAGAGITGTSSATGSSTADVDFDTVVDAVQDLGMDPNGNEPIDGKLASAIESDTLVEFPPGEYLATDEHVERGLSNFGIRGTGDEPGDVKFVFPDGNEGAPDPANYVLLWLEADAGLLLENFELHQTEDERTAASVVAYAGDGLSLRDIVWQGFNPVSNYAKGTCCYPSITRTDGVGHVSGIEIRNGGVMGTYPHRRAGFLMQPNHVGELVFSDLDVRELGSTALRATRCPGVVKVEDSYFENNDNGSIRFGGGDHPSKQSWAKRCKVVVDASLVQYLDGDEEYEDIDACRIDSNGQGWTGGLVEDCEFVYRSLPGSLDDCRGVITRPSWGDHGGFTVRNTTIRVDAENVTPVNVVAPGDGAGQPRAVTLENVHITGEQSSNYVDAAVYVEESDGSEVRNCCIDVPNGDLDGVRIDGSSNCTVASSDIRVGGSATNFTNATVSTSDLTSDGACRLPGDQTAGSGSGMDDGTDSGTDSGSDDSLPNTLSITGTGARTNYSFTVDGELSASSRDTLESWDSLSGSSVQGWVTEPNHTDEFDFSGSVTEFTFEEGSADLTRNGESVTRDELLGDDASDDGESASRLEIHSLADEPGFNYRFTTGGEVTRVRDGSGAKAEPSDTVTDNGDGTYTVSGWTANGWADSFELSEPTLVDFQASTDSGNYFLRLDGQRVTVDELLASDGSGDGTSGSSDGGTSDGSDGDSGGDSDGTATGDNFVFTRREELQAVADRATNADEPWASAWQQVRSSADDALGVSLQAVTDDGNGHGFALDRNDRHDYREAIRTGDRVRNLALAHFVTGEDEYAEKAIDQIHHWFLNGDTYQYPRGSGDYGVEQYITIPKFLMGAALLRGHPYWGTKDATTPWNGGSAHSAEDALAQWATEWADNLTEPNYNNIWVWLAVAEGAAAAYAQDDALFERAVGRYTDDAIWRDYNDDGSFQAALDRSNGFRYQLFRMKAHAMFCELARHRGTDLYGYNDLRRAFDWMAPYVQNPDQWQWGTGSVQWDRTHEAPGVYELGHSVWGDQTYLDVVSTAGRPVDDGRLLQWVTFTHGDLHDVDTGSSDGPSLPHTITVDGTGSETTYRFEVTEAARKVTGDATDTVSGTTIEGSVVDERDVYEFAGAVTGMEVSGDVNVSFDVTD